MRFAGARRFGRMLARLVLVALHVVPCAPFGRLPDYPCADQDTQCHTWAGEGECDNNPDFMLSVCKASCYVCQTSECSDSQVECGPWAADGECRKNHEFMLNACAFSCRVCHIHRNPACQRDAKMEPAAVPGTIDETFELALRRFPQYKPRVLSRAEPWVVAFDEFLQPSEIDQLLAVGSHDFERSLAGDGVTPVRTSSTSWCNVPSCLADATLQRVRERISNVTRVPWQYAEHLQLLRYQPGQFYKEHHDQNAPKHSAWGPRLYTFFMYLSDVEEGGETRFRKLNITVRPKKGMAIWWPSVLSDNPWATDERTFHEAVAVTRGEKYGAGAEARLLER